MEACINKRNKQVGTKLSSLGIMTNQADEMLRCVKIGVDIILFKLPHSQKSQKSYRATKRLI